MPSLGRKGEMGVYCFTSDLEKLKNCVTDGQSIKQILPEPRQHRPPAAAGAGPPRAPSWAAGGASVRRPRGGAGGVRAAQGRRCAAVRGLSPRLPADGVRLAGLRLRGAGGGGRCRGLRQGRWVLVALAIPVPAVPAGSPRSAPFRPAPLRGRCRR